MIRLILPLTVVILLLNVFAYADDWQKEQWTVEPFTDVIGGGPSTGPVMQAGGRVFSLTENKDNFIFLASGQFIDIVTPGGLRYHLAGTGEPGFRDGQAHLAQFYMGKKSVYGSHNIVCGPNGDVFVADSGNNRVRRIFKKENQWMVETWAGGGKRKINFGQSASAKEVRIAGNTLAIAVNIAGETYIATPTEYYKVSTDGSLISNLGPWPESTKIIHFGSILRVIMGDSDLKGNVYFISRSPDFIIRIDSKGKAYNFAGIAHNGKKPLQIGDRLAKDVFLDTPTSIVADQDGEKVYVSCGDEYTIRRVPTDGITNTATLMRNGRWYKASVHPKIAHGPAVVQLNIMGKLKPDGNLTVFMMNHLAGKDNSGILYGWLADWVGMTEYVEGSGLLSTKVFKIYKLPK